MAITAIDMKKLSLFLAGMLLGMFITMNIVLRQRDRALELGPQPGHAVGNSDLRQNVGWRMRNIKFTPLADLGVRRRAMLA
jgi:hypothetical protein